MGYKICIFAFLITAGVLGALLAERNMFEPSSVRQGEFHLKADHDFRLEGVILSPARSPLKKCFPSLLVEPLMPFFLLGGGFEVYLEGYFQSPPVKFFFASILIHAP